MASEFILFTPVNNGVGARLSCSGSTSRVELPDHTGGSVWAINNVGTEYAYLAFGGATIEATTACMAFPPGLSYVGIPNARSTTASPTWIAGITDGDTIPVQITAGNVDIG